ncbi:hypothetical protein [Salipiger bermudensis]|uniref:hypothetical protein n=1 Tax=Salipiger bermudensis TaxID=344736 RepID=UPI003008762C
MQSELMTRRRVLRLTYERYLEADRAWALALSDMKRWFPTGARPYRAAIGDPGSRMRELYETRARALVRLEAARVKFATAKQRLAERQRPTPVQLYLITA